ncbi:MAG: preprotein translocase subunit SecE [Anaerovoracaceae bacterium]|jgi:preprotein translocase subunit SecE
MEKKPVANPNKKSRLSLGSYFKGVKTEMKKVVWPTKREMISYTGVVIFACTFFALLFWGFDSAFLALLRAVLNISI